jgi:glycogen debranching enzyme
MPVIQPRCYAPVEKALKWIDEYGDFDCDRFVEYYSRSKDGIQNQGWKDSGDAIRAEDGTIVNALIALCETQGQVYDAWQRAADLYDVRGQTERAQILRQKADELFERFNTRFWMADEGFYCLGLDGNKQQIRSIASNAGQLLWSGIVPDLWCGWGIRTLSAKHPAYDPLALAKPLPQQKPLRQENRLSHR